MGLFCIGNRELLYSKEYWRVGVVGSRIAGAAEIEQTKSLCHKLVNPSMFDPVEKRKTVIVSGLARGIDTAAHIGGINRTIAVVHNIDKIYPKENQSLVEEILKHDGLIISPYNIEMGKRAFLDRNLLLVDICDQINVMSIGSYYPWYNVSDRWDPTTPTSGTLYTMKYTLKQKKPLYINNGKGQLYTYNQALYAGIINRIDYVNK
jgi:hypothetical protein